MVNKAIKMHQFTKCEAVPETAQIWNIKMLPKNFFLKSKFRKSARQCFFAELTQSSHVPSLPEKLSEKWRFERKFDDTHPVSQTDTSVAYTISSAGYSTTNKPSKTIHLHTGCSRKNTQSFAHDRFRITCRTSCQTKNIQLQYYNSVLFHVIN